MVDDYCRIVPFLGKYELWIWVLTFFQNLRKPMQKQNACHSSRHHISDRFGEERSLRGKNSRQ